MEKKLPSFNIPWGKLIILSIVLFIISVLIIVSIDIWITFQQVKFVELFINESTSFQTEVTKVDGILTKHEAKTMQKLRVRPEIESIFAPVVEEEPVGEGVLDLSEVESGSTQEESGALDASVDIPPIP